MKKANISLLLVVCVAFSGVLGQGVSRPVSKGSPMSLKQKIMIETKLLTDISAIRVDRMGNIFVFDLSAGKIFKFTANGKLVWSTGKKGGGQETFHPFAGGQGGGEMELFGNEIYANDVNANAMLVFDIQTGRYKRTFHYMRKSTNFCVDEKGNIYLFCASDSRSNHPIHKFDNKGNFLFSFGEPMVLKDDYSMCFITAASGRVLLCARGPLLHEYTYKGELVKKINYADAVPEYIKQWIGKYGDRESDLRNMDKRPLDKKRTLAIVTAASSNQDSCQLFLFGGGILVYDYLTQSIKQIFDPPRAQRWRPWNEVGARVVGCSTNTSIYLGGNMGDTGEPTGKFYIYRISK